MGNFENAKKKSDYESQGSMKFALVKTVERYFSKIQKKDVTSSRWKGSFEDGDDVFIITMDLDKKYEVTDKKGNKLPAYFGSCAKIRKVGGGRR